MGIEAYDLIKWFSELLECVGYLRVYAVNQNSLIQLAFSFLDGV
jgi:hypothetical protein